MERETWKDRTRWLGLVIVSLTTLAGLYLVVGPEEVTVLKVAVPAGFHVLGWAAVSKRVVDKGLDALEAVRGGEGDA